MASPPRPAAASLKAKKRVAGWCPKLPENTEFIALRLAWAVVKIAAPRSSFDLFLLPLSALKLFFKKGLHGFKRYV
jgi:hypothetical protein